MKLLIVLFFCLKLSFVLNWPSSTLDAFNDWKNEFRVNFTCQADENRAILNYLKNKERIDEHNENYKNCSSSYALGAWENTIFTEDENNILLNGLRPSLMGRTIFIGGVYINQATKAHFDWTDEGAVTPIRDQRMLIRIWCSKAEVNLSAFVVLKETALAVMHSL